MSSILIRGGRVIDPSQNLDRITNLLIEDGRIAGLRRMPSLRWPATANSP